MSDDGNNTPHLKRAHQAAFLAAFATTGNVSAAAEAAQIDRTRHYAWMVEEDYATLFAAAQVEATEALEREARRRAVDGTTRFKFHEGKPLIHPETGKPYVEHEYSDVLLIFLLKGAAPEKYRERTDNRNENTDRVSVTYNVSPPPTTPAKL